MKNTLLTMTIALFTAMTLFAVERPVSNGSLTLIDKGRTNYVIHHSKTAPASVTKATAELQRLIKKATDVEIPITTEIKYPMICIGDGSGAAGAGLSGESMAYEHFQIITQSGNLYIVGRDTPDGDTTVWSGISRGTQYGVYEFAESVMGVRWLMPGEIGEIIPKLKTLTIPPLNIQDGPDFPYRSLEVLDTPAVKEWAARQRVATSLAYGDDPCAMIMSIGHNWKTLLPESSRAKHPEWDAVGGGKKKVCVSNPGVIEAVAKNAVKWFDEHPGQHMISLSPSDGQNFCRCETCLADTVRDPHGQESVTLNILKFYNAVARIVARQRPGKMVGGFAYGKTTYPPEKPFVLEPNVFICWAPLNYYGLGLYLPKYWEEFENVATDWRKLTDNVGYLNYLHWHRSDSGAPLAPSPTTLKMEFSALKRLEYKAVYQTGHYNWSYGALNNYLLVKLMWNANADVDAIIREWLDLAYGEGAKPMRELYKLIDDAFLQYKIERQTIDGVNRDSYEIDVDKIQSIYVPNFAAIEQLYLDALAKVKNPAAKKRLELFGRDMTVFHHHLKKGGYLDNPGQSSFDKSDEEYAAFLKDKSLPGFPWVMTKRSKPLPPKPKPLKPLEKRSLTISKTAKPPVVDGVVQPEEWKDAVKAEQFRLASGVEPARNPTTVLLTHDGKNLYAVFQCEGESLPAQRHSPLPLDDPRVWDEGTVELMLNFSDNPRLFPHFVVNSSNDRWDGINNNLGANLDWDSAVSRSGDAWVVEMRIPASSLGVDAISGKTGRANLTRSRLTGKKRENSAWNAVNKRFLEPKEFGVWTFE